MLRRWLDESSAGLTLRTMILVAPWRMMSSSASCMLPSPNDISEMTAAVPMMMPSTDRKARSLCSHRLRTASTKLREVLSQNTSTCLRGMANSADGVREERIQVRDQGGGVFGRRVRRWVALVGLDDPVAHADDARGP